MLGEIVFLMSIDWKDLEVCLFEGPSNLWELRQ